MIDTERMICICNDLTIKDIAACIKDNDFESLEVMLESRECPMGDKCESCIEEGYENDGYSLAMVLSLVKQGRL